MSAPALRRLRRGAVAVALLGTLAGCSEAADDVAAPQTTATESPAPLNASPRRPTSLADALLPAADVPTDASGQAWTAGEVTRGRRIATASACQRVPLRDIGATKLRQRRYDNDAPGRVLHTVAAFADDDSARRTYAVLEAWLRGCAETLRAQGRQPGTMPDGLSEVAAPAPSGWAAVFYRLPSGPPDAGVIEAHTVMVDDETLSWLAYRTRGQDYNYEAGQAPPEQAAPAMAQRLHALR